MIIFADGRGKLEAELFITDEDDSSIIISATAPPYPIHLSLDAAEARLLAAKLMDYADQQDLKQ